MATKPLTQSGTISEPIAQVFYNAKINSIESIIATISSIDVMNNTLDAITCDIYVVSPGETPTIDNQIFTTPLPVGQGLHSDTAYVIAPGASLWIGGENLSYVITGDYK